MFIQLLGKFERIHVCLGFYLVPFYKCFPSGDLSNSVWKSTLLLKALMEAILNSLNKYSNKTITKFFFACLMNFVIVSGDKAKGLQFLNCFITQLVYNIHIFLPAMVIRRSLKFLFIVM